MPIQSFQCADTAALYRGERVTRWINIERVALRKLTQLAVSSRLEDLRVPPGNRLELLRGDRAGKYSIRINDQWRICFVWAGDGVYDVEIIDYH